MPIEDLVHVGVSLIGDQRGQAIKCVWTVYVGSVDLAQGALDLGNGGMAVAQAAAAAHEAGMEYLRVQAATRDVDAPPSPPLEDVPATPPSDVDVQAPTTRRRSRPQRAGGRVLASTTDGVERVVDPAVSDLEDDSVRLRENPPANRRRQRSEGARRLGEVRPN